MAKARGNSRNSPGRRLLRWTLRLLLFLFLFFNMSMAFNSWKFTHYYDDPELRKQQPKGTWTTAKTILFGRKAPKRLNDSLPGVPYKTIIIGNRDGLKLEAWSLVAAGQGKMIDTSSVTLHSDHASRATIIMFHGQGSCKSSMLQEAYAFRNFGYNVLMIDFRAHGGSEGQQTTVGIKEAEDVRCAYDFIKGQTGREPILFGISMGAATITRAIAEYNLHPVKVILEMPFGSLDDAVKGFLRTHVKAMPEGFASFITFWGSTLNGGWGFTHKPTEFAKKVTCPALLEWGRLDPRVSKSEVETIFQNLATSKKSLVVYETAAHQSFCRKEHEKWLASVGSFLAGY